MPAVNLPKNNYELKFLITQQLFPSHIVQSLDWYLSKNQLFVLHRLK